MRIEDVREGQMVVITDTQERGRVTRIDYDDNAVYVEVALKRGGTDVTDVDPSEIKLSVNQR